MENTTQTETTVAMTILQQLGGIGRLRAMTGAKDFLAAPNGVQFKVGSNAKKITCMSVTLEANDTYTVGYWTGRGINMKQVTKEEEVYAEDLRPSFERNTGMYLTF